VSRVMPYVAGAGHQAAAQRLRRLMAIYRDNEDLVAIGAYRPGIDDSLDEAVRWHRPIEEFLRQDLAVASPLVETLAGLDAIGA